MSRYNLQPLNDNHDVTVGWDRPLQTFFVIVLETDFQDYEKEVFSAGMLDTITSVEQLQESVAPYAELDDATVTQLEADQNAPQEASLDELEALLQRLQVSSV